MTLELAASDHPRRPQPERPLGTFATRSGTRRYPMTEDDRKTPVVSHYLSLSI